MITVLNDLHIGAIRSGGTTPQTAWALRQNLLGRMGDLFNRAKGDIVINGDLFDEFLVPMTDLWEAVRISSHWLQADPKRRLYAARGNHDIAKNTTIMSAFDMYCRVLRHIYGSQFFAIIEPTRIAEHDMLVIPHMPNQDLFNLALSNAKPAKWLLVHCNYDNKFAVEADHSLNMSKEQAESLPFEHIIFGHEHQQREALGGKVVVVGNQMPSSVADCLNNSSKRLLRLHSAGWEQETVWSADSLAGLACVDWRRLDTDEIDQAFVRVEGTAAAEEATAVISAISRFRGRSAAFVVTNAVTIDGVSTDEEAIRASLSEAKGFDVIEALLSLLDEGFEKETVKTIIEKHNVQTSQVE